MGELQKRWNPTPPNDVLGPSLILTLQTVCGPLVSLQHPVVHLAGRPNNLFSIPATITLVLPFLIKIYMIEFPDSNLASPLHLVNFALGSRCWLLPLPSCSCPLNMGLIVLSLLLLSWLSLKLLAWHYPTGPATSCHCRMEALSQSILLYPFCLIWPSGQTYLFLLSPERIVSSYHIQDQMQTLLHGTHSGRSVFVYPALTPLLLVTIPWFSLKIYETTVRCYLGRILNHGTPIFAKG